MTTLNERIAVLEQKVDQTDKHNKEILLALADIKGELGKYKGFIGAVSFLISCIGIFFTVWPMFKK